MHVKVRNSCRLCGSRSLVPVVDLGSQMLASSFITKGNEDRVSTRKVPLELVRCNPLTDENACGLVQLKHSFPADIMYTEYFYVSGINETMKSALADIVKNAQEFVTLKENDIVIDIGCNDGTLLNSYGMKNLDKIGFDPASNFIGRESDTFHRIPTYFNETSYRNVRGEKKAKIITSIAMFYDLEDPSSFTENISRILDDQGIWVLQMADLPNMLNNNMFDNICHEHLTYYHLSPMEYLLKKHDMQIVDIEMNNVNGSSYRFYIRKKSGPAPSSEATKRLAKIRFLEFNQALDTDVPYSKFKENIERNKHDLLFFLRQIKEQNKTAFVYGASTKGNVLLQYCGITPDLIPYAVDRNPMKWGGRTLGSDIPIISEEEARKRRPDYFLVLPYHFLGEMLERESEFVNRGGKFIVPVPTVRVVP